MELIFKGKRSKEEILADVNTHSFKNNKLNKENSFLINGENLYGLHFLIQNGYKSKIDLVYIDPPYNTNQSFVVSNNRNNSISKSRDGKVAYNDYFSLDEYLCFMHERLVLIHELLSEQGSLYLHIDTKMGHYTKLLLDEIFGIENYKNDITRIKSNPKNFNRTAYGNEKDMILFYAKNHNKNIWNNITIKLSNEEIEKRYPKMDKNGRYTTIPLHAPGVTIHGNTGIEWRGMQPPDGRHWRTDPKEFDILDANNMIEWSTNGNPRIKKYVKDHKGKKVQDIWKYKDPQHPIYPTQKNQSMLEFIIKQSSNQNSIILDCFVGGGTTLYACEKLNRKWIGIDKSELSIETIQNNLNIQTKYDLINLNKIIKNNCSNS